MKSVLKNKSYKYPKTLIFILAIIVAYFAFKNPVVIEKIQGIESLGNLGIFFSGMLFAAGFSAPFAVGYFILTNPPNIFIAAIIAGAGALTIDFLFFETIRYSFEDEFKSLVKSKPVKIIFGPLKKFLDKKTKRFLLYTFAGILIASPLPNEVGVTILAGLTKITPRMMAAISFTLNTIGIFIILTI